MQNPAPALRCGNVADNVPQRPDPNVNAGLLPDLPDDGLLGMLAVVDAASRQ